METMTTIFTVENTALNAVEKVFSQYKIIKTHEPVPMAQKGESWDHSYSMPLGVASTIQISGEYSRNKLKNLLGRDALVRGVKRYKVATSHAKRGNLDSNHNWFEVLEEEGLGLNLDFESKNVVLFEGEVEIQRPRIIIKQGKTKYALVHSYYSGVMSGYEQVAWFKITNGGGIGYTLYEKMELEYNYAPQSLLDSWKPSAEGSCDFCIKNNFFMYWDHYSDSPIGVSIEGFTPSSRENLKEFLRGAFPDQKYYTTCIDTLYAWLTE